MKIGKPIRVIRVADPIPAPRVEPRPVPEREPVPVKTGAGDSSRSK